MTTQATAACPIQISVVLDSGVFLTRVDEEKYPECRIGYFAPDFRIFGDWRPIACRDLTKPVSPPDPSQPTAYYDLTWARIGSREIVFRLFKADGSEKKDGVILSEALRKHLLRRIDVYKDELYSPPIIEARFDWIFTFSSGFFRCSNVKDRFFKQCSGTTHVPNSKRKKFDKIAHDVVVHFELAHGERLVIAVGNEVFWNSSEYKDVEKRFDIEVIGPHATAENYYRDALDHQGNDYWLPNQGDPGPMGGRP
jgi:hypothetical protein